jgi:hypothetical protein
VFTLREAATAFSYFTLEVHEYFRVAVFWNFCESDRHTPLSAHTRTPSTMASSASPAPASGSDVPREIFDESAVMEFFKHKQRDWMEGFQYPEKGGSFKGNEGPIVLAEGKNAVFDLGAGLKHGNARQTQVATAIWRDGGYQMISYCYRDKTVELSGPLTAFGILQELALAVRFEVVRNEFMSDMLTLRDNDEIDYDREDAPSKLPVFPPEQASQYQTRPARGTMAAVLDVHPNPMGSMLSTAYEKLCRHWEERGSCGGVTAFKGFKKHVSEPGVWVLQWSEPFC